MQGRGRLPVLLRPVEDLIWEDGSSPRPAVPQILVTIQEVSVREDQSWLKVSLGPLIVPQRLVGTVEIMAWSQAGYPFKLDRQVPMGYSPATSVIQTWETQQ